MCIIPWKLHVYTYCARTDVVRQLGNWHIDCTPCLKKKLCQLIFCSLSVKCELISIKIGRIVLEETRNETLPKLATSPKVCACTTLGNLKCQIEPSTQIIKCIFEWLTEWQQTITWLAVIVSQDKPHVSPHIIFITVCAQNVRLQHERKHVDAAPLSYSTFNNHVTRSGPLAVDASFQFVDVRDRLR